MWAASLAAASSSRRSNSLSPSMARFLPPRAARSQRGSPRRRHGPRPAAPSERRRARRDRAGQGAPRPPRPLPPADRRPPRPRPPRAVALRAAVVPALRRLRGRPADLPAPPARRDARGPARPRALPRLAVPAPDDPHGALLPLGGLRAQPP